MAHLIEVAFRGNRKEFFQWDAETAPALRAGVIVEADRGEDLGRVHSTGELAEIRAADLRFTAEEAAEYLNGAMGLELTATDEALVPAFSSQGLFHRTPNPVG